MDAEPPLSLFSSFTAVFGLTTLQFAMPDFEIIVQFVAFFILLCCSALISGSEVALFSLSSTEINAAKEGKSPIGKIIAKLLDNPKKLLATILIANNLVNISIVLLFVDLGNFIFAGIENELLRAVLDIGVVTFMILLCGEILPKIYANRNNIAFAYKVAYPIYLLDTLFFSFEPSDEGLYSMDSEAVTKKIK